MPIYLFSAPAEGIELADLGINSQWETLWPAITSACRLGRMTMWVCGPGLFDVSPKYGDTRPNQYLLGVDAAGETATFSVNSSSKDSSLAMWGYEGTTRLSGTTRQIRPVGHIGITTDDPRGKPYKWLLQTVIKHSPGFAPDVPHATPIGGEATQPPSPTPS